MKVSLVDFIICTSFFICFVNDTVNRRFCCFRNNLNLAGNSNVTHGVISLHIAAIVYYINTLDGQGTGKADLIS